MVVTSNGDRMESKHENLYDNEEVGAEQLNTPSSGIIRARLRQVSLVTVISKIINSVYGTNQRGVENFNIQSELQKK